MATYTRKYILSSRVDGSIKKYLETYSQPRFYRFLYLAYHQYHTKMFPVFKVVQKIEEGIHNLSPKNVMVIRFEQSYMPITNRQAATCEDLSRLKVSNSVSTPRV